jgi:hypothetical protein
LRFFQFREDRQQELAPEDHQDSLFDHSCRLRGQATGADLREIGIQKKLAREWITEVICLGISARIAITSKQAYTLSMTVHRISFALLLLLLLCFDASKAPAQRVNPVLEFTGDTLSASVERVKLGIVLEQIERETRIWFKGSRGVFEKEVTAEFSDLALEEGIRKILRSLSLNHSCIFDSQRQLIGVYLYGEAGQGDRSLPAASSGPSHPRGLSVSAPVQTAPTGVGIPEPRQPAGPGNHFDFRQPRGRPPVKRPYKVPGPGNAP